MLMLKERLLCKLLVDFELNAHSEGQASVATWKTLSSTLMLKYKFMAL